MLKKICDRTPGFYFHVSYKALGWMIAFALIIAVLCVQSVHISLNPPPKEFPMFIDDKKIVFLGYEPRSVAEAQEIMARFRHNFKDGDRIAVPEGGSWSKE